MYMSMSNSAPEKIYLQENTTTDCYGEFWPEWFEARAKDSDIEYTRTDAFIEKVVGRLKHYLDNSVWVANDVGVREKEVIIEDFVNYIKGE